MMLRQTIGVLTVPLLVVAEVHDRAPLSYVPKPEAAYVLPTSGSTLLDFINSRADLSSLSKAINGSAGFPEAFATPPSWDFTFFAPNNNAFENTGQYYSSFATTAKGPWWVGNLIQHHYIPNTKLNTTAFNTTFTRIQTSTYLFVGTQIVNGGLVLNKASKVQEADIPVTRGIVHVVDRILDPAFMIFEDDVPWIKQGFIAGSCSNPNLPYC
ncbi:FAS1 domain-containing protein [Paramyrothecium foliicola]|nr:FAS1 domain-containing protein [Paramyrothecium foliicola]